MWIHFTEVGEGYTTKMAENGRILMICIVCMYDRFFCKVFKYIHRVNTYDKDDLACVLVSDQES